jgi:hypothetical protein
VEKFIANGVPGMFNVKNQVGMGFSGETGEILKKKQKNFLSFENK